jgi:hypothetical protein
VRQSRSLRMDGHKAVGPSGSRSRGRRSAAVASLPGPVGPNLWEILGRFDRALSLLTVCHQSLAAKESAVVGDEEEVLRQGIRLLRNVHQELDRSGTKVKSHRPSR